MTAAPDTAGGPRDLIAVVQRFGLFSAVSVVDRYAEIVDRAVARELVPEQAGGDLAGRLGQAWLRLLDEATARLREDAPGRPPTETLILPVVGPGSSSEVSMWIHNTTSSPVVAVELHRTALLSAGGRSIPADAVTLVPDRVDSVPAGTSREIRLRVRVPADQAAATYHGMVVSTAAPAEPMALSLEVCGG